MATFPSLRLPGLMSQVLVPQPARTCITLSANRLRATRRRTRAPCCGSVNSRRFALMLLTSPDDRRSDKGALQAHRVPWAARHHTAPAKPGALHPA